tara:strand:- start:434 stop:1468 length:1035 start_codon:yes stop_codon:yes gene_type:complete
MAEIVNEIPDELEMEGEEVEVDLNKKDNKSEKSTADVERVEPEKPKQAELDLEVEEEDDTPLEDQGKEPLPKDMVADLENDTLEDYSERVKQRMAQLKKVWHDERRAKEEASREKEEAIAYAQKVAEQNKKLQTTLSSGEEDYIKTVLSSAEAEVNIAKRDYREAYDTGDTDQIVEAQAKMNDAQMKLMRAQALKPQYKSLQPQENNVELSQQNSTPKVPKPDAKAQAWQEKNTWFGKDEEMTSLALGLHEKLVRSGIDPTSDTYYHRIDETMQKRFPENFGDNSLESDKPAQRKPSNVVAPATRSTAPKKVRLSKTQVAFAKKLKLTPEQYAREMIKLENANG